MIEKEIPDIEEESELKKTVKIIYRAVIALFLMMLFLSIFLFGNTIFSIFEGQVVSDEINQDFEITLDSNSKVIFNDQTYPELKALYLANQKTEIKVCLEGEKTNNNYHVRKVVIPKTYDKSVFQVRAEQCSKETIISLHTHPFKHCIFSQQDLRSYEAFKEINQDSILGVMCEIDRFTFHGYKGKT